MRVTYSLILIGLIGAVAGCQRASEVDTSQASGTATPSAEGRRYLLTTQPDGAQSVLDAREHAADDEEIVVVGRIGGTVKPWVDGMAAFTIVDESLRACSDIPGDTCPTPWDYCCEADIGQKQTLVKFVDEQGKPLAIDARGLLGVTELDTVVIRGKARRDADGNLTLLASQMYVSHDSADHALADDAHKETEHYPAHDGAEEGAHDHPHDASHPDRGSDVEPQDGASDPVNEN